jgi:hypothetical protein
MVPVALRRIGHGRADVADVGHTVGVVVVLEAVGAAVAVAVVVGLVDVPVAGVVGAVARLDARRARLDVALQARVTGVQGARAADHDAAALAGADADGARLPLARHLVDAPVAVLVDVVADVGVRRQVEAVADEAAGLEVAHRPPAEVTADPGPPRTGLRDEDVVDLAVAVVVEPVAALGHRLARTFALAPAGAVGGARLPARATLAAPGPVRRRAVAFARGAGVAPAVEALVDAAVAVGVAAAARLGGGRDRAEARAVERPLPVDADAPAIPAGADRRRARTGHAQRSALGRLVEDAIAVVVGVVAGLLARQSLVEALGEGAVPADALAHPADPAQRRVFRAVVAVPGQGEAVDALVDDAIAVVVDAVARLAGRYAGRGVALDGAAGAADGAGGTGAAAEADAAGLADAGHAFVDEAVAVVVGGVAPLVGAGDARGGVGRGQRPAVPGERVGGGVHGRRVRRAGVGGARIRGGGGVRWERVGARCVRRESVAPCGVRGSGVRRVEPQVRDGASVGMRTDVRRNRAAVPVSARAAPLFDAGRRQERDPSPRAAARPSTHAPPPDPEARAYTRSCRGARVSRGCRGPSRRT